jgi:hypothetical protein
MNYRRTMGITTLCLLSLSSAFAQYSNIKYQNIMCKLYNVIGTTEMAIGESTALSTSIMDYDKFRTTSEANSASVNRVNANGQSELKTFSWKVSYISRYNGQANMLPRLGLKIGRTSAPTGGRTGSVRYEELVTTAMPVPFLVNAETNELLIDPTQRFELIFSAESLKIVCGSF